MEGTGVIDASIASDCANSNKRSDTALTGLRPGNATGSATGSMKYAIGCATNAGAEADGGHRSHLLSTIDPELEAGSGIEPLCADLQSAA